MVEESKELNKANSKRKVLILILSVCAGLVVLAGVFALVYYLATIGKVNQGDLCISNLSCLTNSNLACVNSRCTCPTNTTWQQYICVASNQTNSTQAVSNTTNATSVIIKAQSIFVGASYTKTTWNNYNGTSFNYPLEMKLVNTSDYMFMMCDLGNRVILLYDENRVLKRIYNIECHYLEYYNGYVYVSTWNGNVGFAFKFDINFNWIASYYFGSVQTFGVAYNEVSDYVYICDMTNGWIRAFDKNLNYNNSQSWARSGAADLDTYRGYLYIVTTGNQLFIYDGTTLLNTYSSICKTGVTMNIYIHQDSGYMIISCFDDVKVYLWYTNGTQAFFTGLFLNAGGRPRSVVVDNYGSIYVFCESPSRYEIYSL